MVRLNDDGVKINKCDGRLWDNYLIRCNYCGSVMSKPVWWLKLQFIFKVRVYYHCSECHNTSCYISHFNMIHDTTDEGEKEFNKIKKWDDRIR